MLRMRPRGRWSVAREVARGFSVWRHCCLRRWIAVPIGGLFRKGSSIVNGSDQPGLRHVGFPGSLREDFSGQIPATESPGDLSGHLLTTA